MRLYHVTSTAALESIENDGFLRGPSFWCSWDELVDYYRETVEDEGGVPAVVTVDAEALDAALLAPDTNSVAEPIMSAVRSALDLPRHADEDAVAAIWEERDGTWQDSIDVVGSAVYRGEVPYALLERDDRRNPSPRASGA